MENANLPLSQIVFLVPQITSISTERKAKEKEKEQREKEKDMESNEFEDPQYL